MHDVFGNSVTLLEFTDAGQPSCGSRAGSSSSSSRSTSRTIGVAADAERWPFAYDAEDRRDLGPDPRPPLPRPGGEVRAWALELLGGASCGTLELLTRLTREIKHRLRYVARDDEGTQAPLETLAKGGGTCRDYAL